MRRPFSISLLLCACAIDAPDPSVETRGICSWPAVAADLRTWTEASGMVFRGTVVGSEIPPELDVGTALIVEMDELVLGSALAAGWEGVGIDVLPLTTTTLVPGDERIFFVEGIAYGTRVIVREIAHAEATTAVVDGALEARRQADARARALDLAAADLVFVGTVAEVGEPRPFAFDWEHDPLFADAIVDVEEILADTRGGGATDRVVVRFPWSFDVAWFASPKLAVGDRVLLVGHDDTDGGDGFDARDLAGAFDVVVYHADPLDVRPADAADEAAALLDCPPP